MNIWDNWDIDPKVVNKKRRKEMNIPGKVETLLEEYFYPSAKMLRAFGAPDKYLKCKMVDQRDEYWMLNKTKTEIIYYMVFPHSGIVEYHRCSHSNIEQIFKTRWCVGYEDINKFVAILHRIKPDCIRFGGYLKISDKYNVMILDSKKDLSKKVKNKNCKIGSIRIID